MARRPHRRRSRTSASSLAVVAKTVLVAAAVLLVSSAPTATATDAQFVGAIASAIPGADGVLKAIPGADGALKAIPGAKELGLAGAATASNTEGNAAAAAGTAGGSGVTQPNDDTPSDWMLSKPDSPGKMQMIPFGKHVPRVAGTSYVVASGAQECMQCQMIIVEAYIMGTNFWDLCSYNVRGDDTNAALCFAQQQVLQSCPEFVNDWCYQDLGGTQQLRSPCPDYLKCHYCLGINPLYCVAANN